MCDWLKSNKLRDWFKGIRIKLDGHPRAIAVLTCTIWVLERILSGIFNPVVFLSMIAPSAISVSLLVICGKMSVSQLTPAKIEPSTPKCQCKSNSLTGSANESSISILLTNPNIPGIVDYVVQFYTAFLAWMFCVFSFFQRLLVPYFLHRKFDKLKPLKRLSVIVLIYLGMLVVFFGVWVFLLGGAATQDVISCYIRWTPRFGEWHIPPPESPISWIRLLVVLYSVFQGLSLGIGRDVVVRTKAMPEYAET